MQKSVVSDCENTVFLQNRDYFGAKIVHIPLLYSIKKKWPDIKLTLWAPYENGQIFLDLGLVSEFINYKNLSLFKMRKRLFLKKQNLILNLRPESGRLNLLMSLVHSYKKISFAQLFNKFIYDDTIENKLNIYRANNFLRLIEPLGCDQRLESFFVEKMNFNWSPARNIKKFMFIVGAGGKGKKWPLESFFKLQDLLSERFKNIEITFLLGPHEITEKEQILKRKANLNSFHQNINVLEGPSIYDLVQELSKTTLVVGNDAGPTHVAQLCGVPFLSLNKATTLEDYKVVQEWNRLNKNSQFIMSPFRGEMKDISPLAVVSVAMSLLSRQVRA